MTERGGGGGGGGGGGNLEKGGGVGPPLPTMLCFKANSVRTWFLSVWLVPWLPVAAISEEERPTLWTFRF